MWSMCPYAAPAVGRLQRRRSTFEVRLPARALLHAPLGAVRHGAAWLRTGARAGAASASTPAATAVTTNANGNPTFDLESIDWFVWEPVDSAHKFVPAHPSDPSGEKKAVPLTEEDRASVAIAAPEPPLGPKGVAVLQAPVGRIHDRAGRVMLPRPCTVRDLLTATNEFYTQAVTIQDVEAVGEVGCEGYSDAVMDELQGNLLNGKPALGRAPMLVDTCGVPAHPDLSVAETEPLRYSMRKSMSPPCETDGPPRLYGAARRDPVLHCQGRVRFWGVDIYGSDTRARYETELDGAILLGWSTITSSYNGVRYEHHSRMGKHGSILMEITCAQYRGDERLNATTVERTIVHPTH